MNYCTKCESFYQKPGTCNCFAGTQGQPAIRIVPPHDPNSTGHPWPGYQPWIQPTVTWGGDSGNVTGSFTYYFVTSNAPQA